MESDGFSHSLSMTQALVELATYLSEDAKNHTNPEFARAGSTNAGI